MHSWSMVLNAQWVHGPLCPVGPLPPVPSGSMALYTVSPWASVPRGVACRVLLMERVSPEEERPRLQVNDNINIDITCQDPRGFSVM